MKQKRLNTYYIGHDQVELILRDGTGGEYYLMPEKGRIARIKIGADYKYWWEVVTVLLHEAFELILDKMYCRYSKTQTWCRDDSNYLFVFTHQEFSEATGRVSDFVTDALPDLSKEWKKWKKKNDETRT